MKKGGTGKQNILDRVAEKGEKETFTRERSEAEKVLCTHIEKKND